MEINVLAFDLGAGSGRGFLGRFDGERLHVEEMSRFDNQPLRIGRGIYWNHLQLYREILNTLVLCRKRGLKIDCIAIDSWAHDYALLNKDGRWIGMPHSYRDQRTKNARRIVEGVMSGENLFEITGVGKLNISTLHQLAYERAYERAAFDHADKMLFIPSMLIYMLSGEMVCEDTLPSLGQLLDIRTREFSEEILYTFDLASLMPPLLRPGQLIGKTNRAVCDETGYSGIPIALVGSHDTASAISAITGRQDLMFISSGTWSMLGITGDRPYLDPQVYAQNLSNALTANGKVALLKGMTGMYIMQQCLREWEKEGYEADYPALDAYAADHEANGSFDIDSIQVTAPDMRREVRLRVQEAGGQPPDTPEALYLCLIKSLAEKYAGEIAAMESVTGRRFDTLHVFGGGARAKVLNTLTAALTGKRIITGYTEATAIGNMLCQLQSLGLLKPDEADALPVDAAP